MLKFYVYAYLRTKELTPYYIGKGSNRRHLEPHGGHITVPKDRKRIVFLEINLTELGAFALERRYIRWYGRKDNGTGILRNLTDGGEGASGMIVSEETRKKLSIFNSGANNAFYGQTHTTEVKAIIKEKRKFQIFTEETREKLSENGRNREPFMLGKSAWNKNGTISDSQKQDISNTLKEYYKENPSPTLGRKATPEERKRLSESQKEYNILNPKIEMECPFLYCDKKYKGQSALTRHMKSCDYKDPVLGSQLFAKRIQCPHCEIYGTHPGNMKRYHY